MAAHSKIHDEGIRLRIMESLAEGNYIETACAAAGISALTLRNWRKKGEEALRKAERGEELTKTEQLYAQFLEELGTNRALGEQKLVTRITMAARTDWRAAAWILERAFPERWAKRDPPDEPIDYDKMADAIRGVLSGR